MRCAEFSALEGGSVTVAYVVYGRDMHYTYLMSGALRCSGIVPFCGVCGQAVWYVAFPTLCQNTPRGPEFESGWGEFSAPGIYSVLSPTSDCGWRKTRLVASVRPG